MNVIGNFSGIEQRVRERAYALWEREGRPFGRDVEHWRVSEQATFAELSETAPAKKSAKPKVASRKASARRTGSVLEMSAGA